MDLNVERFGTSLDNFPRLWMDSVGNQESFPFVPMMPVVDIRKRRGKRKDDDVNVGANRQTEIKRIEIKKEKRRN